MFQHTRKTAVLAAVLMVAFAVSTSAACTTSFSINVAIVNHTATVTYNVSPCTTRPTAIAVAVKVTYNGSTIEQFTTTIVVPANAARTGTFVFPLLHSGTYTVLATSSLGGATTRSITIP